MLEMGQPHCSVPTYIRYLDEHWTGAATASTARLPMGTAREKAAVVNSIQDGLWEGVGFGQG